MLIFTIINGEVLRGAKVVEKTLKNINIKIPVIAVGEEGRGGKLSYIPVQLLPSEKIKLEKEGKIEIFNCNISTTQKGGYKLIQTEEYNYSEKCLIIFRTSIGFRGGNAHTSGKIKDVKDFVVTYENFPGEIITEGKISQGAAGRMGSGKQIIAVMPKDTIFRTAYYGRLYGAPSEHFYWFDANNIQGGLTKEEKELFESVVI